MTDHSWVFSDLFSKFGFGDGDAPGAEEIHAAFSAHLTASGFENRRVSSLHNERVVEILVGGEWYETWGLTGGPPWTLIVPDTSDDVPVPPELERTLLAFAPRAAEMIERSRAGLPPQ